MYLSNPVSQQWKYISEITRAIAEHLDLGSVLRRALRFAVELVEGEAGLIALRDVEDRFQFVAHYGVDPRLLPRFEPLLTEIPSSLEEGDLRGQFPQLSIKFAGVLDWETLRLQHVMAMPLIASHRLVGVIYVFRPPRRAAFTALDQDALASFSDHVAIAVQNAQLYEDAQRRTKEMEAIIEGSTNGLVVADAHGHVRHFNRATEVMTGWPSESDSENTLAQVVRVRDARGELVILPSFQGGQQPVFVTDGYLERRDGARGPFAHVIIAPLYDASGALFSLLCSLVDISRFKESEDLKTGFLTGISHDFKTPLALIRGYAETLRNPDVKVDAATLDSSLAIIEDEAKYLTNLVNALLDAAQVQAGELPLKLAPVRVEEIARQVVQRIQALGDAHQWSLQFPAEFPEVEADAERIRQALQNLIGNAIKYSPAGTLIAIGGWVEEERVGVFVRDQGPGVPLEEQERIFERFARGRGEMARQQRGAGLGLYLCRAIVERHGGRIWVENMPGGGASFYFTLPRNRVE